jgi:C1A family cysteine protease
MNSLPLSPENRRYGAFRSKPDHRDFGMASFFANRIPPPLPAVVDNSQWLGPVKDQGDLGACTAFAGTGMAEYLFRKWQGQSPVLSPLEVYYLERQHDGNLANGDTGSTGATLVWVMNKLGACLETSDTYNPANFQVAPTQVQLAEGLKYRLGPYHSMSLVEDMKVVLAMGYVFIVGFTVYESFEGSAIAANGLMPMPNEQTEQILGGHEVLFYGYDNSIICPGASAGAFMVRNSWGSGWGLGGNFRFPFQAVADPNIFMDSKMQHFGAQWDGSEIPKNL